MENIAGSWLKGVYASEYAYPSTIKYYEKSSMSEFTVGKKYQDDPLLREILKCASSGHFTFTISRGSSSSN